jgi:hypothetical protein
LVIGTRVIRTRPVAVTVQIAAICRHRGNKFAHKAADDRSDPDKSNSPWRAHAGTIAHNTFRVLNFLHFIKS